LDLKREGELSHPLGVDTGDTTATPVSTPATPSATPAPKSSGPRLTKANAERTIQPTDELTEELTAIAAMATVQDVAGAWLKFTGLHAGQWKHVAGAWQKFCVTEAKFERTEREKERDRAKKGGAVLTEDGLDPMSFEACQRRKKKQKAEDEVFVQQRLAEMKASAGGNKS
jgi:hypothetical protein